MNITDKLQIIRNALHTGQISAAKVDGQRAFNDVQQFVQDVLAIVTLTQARRSDTGGSFEFAVSGSGESWGAYVMGEDVKGLNSRQARTQFRSFEEALRGAGNEARRLLDDMAERSANEDPSSR